MEYFLMKRPENTQECGLLGCAACIEAIDKTAPCAYQAYLRHYQKQEIDQQIEKINKNMSRMAEMIAKLEEKT